MNDPYETLKDERTVGEYMAPWDALLHAFNAYLCALRGDDGAAFVGEDFVLMRAECANKAEAFVRAVEARREGV